MNAARSHWLRSLIWVVGLVAIVAVVWWRANSWESPAANTAGSGLDYSTGLTLYPAGERPAAPKLSGTTLDGNRLALSDLAGHVVVVNVWGSWCAPCREEAPDLARLSRETADRGVRFVGIDTRDNVAAARAFVRNFDIPYPSLVDRDGQLLAEFVHLVPISAVPSTVVIDADGRVAAKVIGRVTYSTLHGLITDELSGGGRANQGAGGGS
jgi:thiol-disulfide isomerase/thioredoxin